MKTSIKHTILLIVALVLMVDLAEDGCFGQATVDLPHAFAKTSVNTPHHNSSGQVDFRPNFTPANLWEPPSQANYQPATSWVPPTLKIIDYRNPGSSGGIPR